VSSFPLSTSVVSWKNLGSLSSPAPSNPIRGNYGCNGTNGSRDGKDTNAD